MLVEPGTKVIEIPMNRLRKKSIINFYFKNEKQIKFEIKLKVLIPRGLFICEKQSL